MEQIHQKSQVSSIDSKRSLDLTQFEDLANELLYEIFEYLDYFHVYEIFFNLNKRFQNLFINSTHWIKINLLSLSKSTFEYYSKSIIIPYKNQIQSLHLSNPFIIELFLSSSLSLIPRLIHLQTFIIKDIQLKYIENLLNDLFVLPNLSSLVISCRQYVTNRNNLYKQIFRLSTLKYCKLSLKTPNKFESLPVETNEFSSIEHLVIEDVIGLNEFYALLSYVPQLQRLSINQLSTSKYIQVDVSPIVSNQLTHVSLNLGDVIFDDFEPLIKNLFHEVQVLHISTPADRTYLIADRWKFLILSYMPHLRVFDILHHVYTNSIENDIYTNLVDQFKSSFWLERQWFFAYHIGVLGENSEIYFYSTDPYRRRQFKLDTELMKRTAPYTKQTHMNSVQHLELENENVIINWTNYFPKVTQLTFKLYPFEENKDISPNIFNRIFPLEQITQLNIVCFDLYLKNVIQLISFLPNIHILHLGGTVSNKVDLDLIQQNETFHMVSMTNKIKYVKTPSSCTFEHIKLLVNLFPRLEHLVIIMLRGSIEEVIQYLLSKNNDKTRYLHSLWIGIFNPSILQKIIAVLQSDQLLVNCAMDFDQFIRLWW